MKVDVAFSHGFPRFTAMHQRTQVPVSVGNWRGRSSQHLGSYAARCLTQKLMNSPFSGFLENDFDVREAGRQGGDRR